MDRHADKDEVTICRGDLCNDQPIDPARYCVDPLREVGVGRLAAKIIQSTAERTTPFDPILFWFMPFLLN